MRVVVVVFAAVLIGCSWSNSLYHARRLSSAAQRAEREERFFEAGSLWGQAAVKADSASARDPAQAEAAWLRGQARARLFYVLPGETPLIILTDPEGAARDAGKPPPDATPDRWYETLWSSVEAANSESQQ